MDCQRSTVESHRIILFCDAVCTPKHVVHVEIMRLNSATVASRPVRTSAEGRTRIQRINTRYLLFAILWPISKPWEHGKFYSSSSKLW